MVGLYCLLLCDVRLPIVMPTYSICNVRFPIVIGNKVCCCCLRSAILCGSEAWCLKENEKAILRKTTEQRELWREPCVVRSN